MDEIFVYDDDSSDDSISIALAHECIVDRRPVKVPSFLEHEGQFRQAAWDTFVDAVKPVAGDWVCAFDADEILVDLEGEDNKPTDVWMNTWKTCRRRSAADGIIIRVPEVWETDPLMLRTDGYWNSLSAPRLFRYQPEGKFRDVPMGCGSTPTYVTEGLLVTEPRLQVLHLGYANPNDRKDKFNRYKNLPGHSMDHINSIMTKPELKKWEGPQIDLYRGRRG